MINNQIEIKGNLGQDIKIAKTQSGKSVGTFSVAVSRKDSAGNKITDWFKCVSWDRQADWLAGNVHKGDTIRVRGTMENHAYTDSNGNNVNRWQINIQEFDITQRVQAQQTQQQVQQTQQTNYGFPPADDNWEQTLDIGFGDLPF